ncbi:hypothetical protein SERLA73DRAFT_190320 [Serpula lacrymans var. lacrymans S7.3]|uniref:Uncharacterized protein n=2 Tax=Serpula lacrymans var. lacrymans TaxID=341189 RepID=F8QFG8_SERL3|nr:uncharacterized protein SERLADRAFT_479346 [Serpula lacrymans var. lacrymans S7.9]EGN92952.1 hypothetical protein SERLA73DRAFT_190320 [Serpula lacrymans var. lacrymans S7.3]EGO19668.1 hypothetical protein SERLADRAFT_479346 [Serpula lacrymans var. lacrymans S7.9]
MPSRPGKNASPEEREKYVQEAGKAIQAIAKKLGSSQGIVNHCLREQCVPMPRLTPNSYDYFRQFKILNTVLDHLILFEPSDADSREGHSTSCTGVAMSDCLSMWGMKDPFEPVFSAQRARGVQFITFVLTWPGYKGLHMDWRFEISIQSVPTRDKLAYIIAGQFRDFIEAVDKGRYQAEDDNLHWTVGNGGYNLGHMKLSALWNAADGLWAANVRVVDEV